MLKETTDALYEWKEAYEALEGENVEMEKEIEALGAELDQVSKGGPGSSASGGPARKEVRQLQQALAAVQSELEQAKAALAEQISDKDEVERLADKAEALGLEINTFKQELRDSKSESEGYRQGFSLYQGLYTDAQLQPPKGKRRSTTDASGLKPDRGTLEFGKAGKWEYYHFETLYF